jgi:hypothetical protein
VAPTVQAERCWWPPLWRWQHWPGALPCSAPCSLYVAATGVGSKPSGGPELCRVHPYTGAWRLWWWLRRRPQLIPCCGRVGGGCAGGFGGSGGAGNSCTGGPSAHDSHSGGASASSVASVVEAGRVRPGGTVRTCRSACQGHLWHTAASASMLRPETCVQWHIRFRPHALFVLHACLAIFWKKPQPNH